MTDRQRIDRSREARLWISQVIIPTATVIGTIATIPEVRQAAVIKFKNVKQKTLIRLKRIRLRPFSFSRLKHILL